MSTVPAKFTVKLRNRRSDGTSDKKSASIAGGMSRSNLSHVANDSSPLQPWCVGPGAKPSSWAPLTHDTRKGIKRV